MNSFKLEQTDEILEFLNEQGYVVIDNILTASEVHETLDEINQMMKEKERMFDLFDAATYDYAPISSNYGIFDVNHSKIIKRNRTHPNVIAAYKMIYGNSSLKLEEGDMVFYRPTLINSKWRTNTGLHFDFDPMSYYLDIKADGHTGYAKSEGDRYQGFINLVSNRIKDGGFVCAPGSHLRFDEWLELKKKYLEPSKSGTNIFKLDPTKDEDKKLIREVIRVPMKAGSLIIFHKKLAHGSKPNESERVRIMHICSYSVVH